MSRFFRILVGVMFLLWSAACTINACGHWSTFMAIRGGAVYDPSTGTDDPSTWTFYRPMNEIALYWGVSLLVALGTLGTGGYLVTKK